MKNYDYHRPAEKVLLDSYRKQNRNKNRLLFLAVALTVGVIFCMISFAYGKIQVDIQKHIRTDGMTVSTYLENGTEEMAGQLHTLSYIAETGKEKFAGKLCNQTIKYCDCVVADETAFETMLSGLYTNRRNVSQTGKRNHAFGQNLKVSGNLGTKGGNGIKSGFLLE